jgi:hypothetical protein
MKIGREALDAAGRAAPGPLAAAGAIDAINLDGCRRVQATQAAVARILAAVSTARQGSHGDNA